MPKSAKPRHQGRASLKSSRQPSCNLTDPVLEDKSRKGRIQYRELLDTTTGAPVSDPACRRGTLDLAGSETGAPVAVIRRAQHKNCQTLWLSWCLLES